MQIFVFYVILILLVFFISLYIAMTFGIAIHKIINNIFEQLKNEEEKEKKEN